MYIRTRMGGLLRKCEYGKDKYRNLKVEEEFSAGFNVVKKLTTKSQLFCYHIRQYPGHFSH